MHSSDIPIMGNEAFSFILLHSNIFRMDFLIWLSSLGYFAQLIFVFSVKCGRYSAGSVRGQGRRCLFFASASQGPVNHKPNESQMNTAAFADQSVISCAHWSLAEAIILSSATNSASLPLIMLHKLDRLKDQGFEICRSFRKNLEGKD